MKILLDIFLILIVPLSFPSIIFAHPGNTDSLGCHTCRTNCESWGLYYGEYHCHEPKYNPPPDTYSPPEIYSPPKIPSCPLFSYYDSLSDSCKCYSGYIASGDRCISQDEYCQNIYGFNSRYNILSDTCECSYGYVSDGSKCISGNQYCWNRYGYNSSYDSLSKSCECSYGYVLNRSGTKCISRDDWCEELFGFNSEYDSLDDNCKCSDGYRYEGGECILDSSDYEYRVVPEEVEVPYITIPPLKLPQKEVILSTPTSSPQFVIPTSSQEITSIYKPPYTLTKELRLNSKEEEVGILQSALATEKELYPEGIISGFFGQATEKAVKRFQVKYGIEETGISDSETLAKFNEVFGKKEVSISPSPLPSRQVIPESNWQRNLFLSLWKFITGFWRR